MHGIASFAGNLCLFKDMTLEKADGYSFYSSRPLAQSSFLSMSLTADLMAALLLGYMLALTSSSNPSR